MGGYFKFGYLYINIKTMSEDIRKMIDKVKNFKQFVNENQYQDNALDKINKLGGFKNLPDIDKLALLSDSDKYEELKKLNLSNIYKDNGGTFGRFNIKIMVKPLKEQPIDHRFSKEFQNKIGWLYPYIDYDDSGNGYVTVRFDEYIPDNKMKGGGIYTERPIMLKNIFPIAITDVKSEFKDYDKRIDVDRNDFLNRLGFDSNEFNW